MNKKLKNYFLAAWIANLGVVPLFRLAAFLLAPLFCFLRALTVSVILVFDTMINLHIFTRFPLLLIMLTFVKVFIHLPPLLAQDVPSIMLKLGESKSYPVQKLKKYSISNKSILSVKPLDAHHLLLKATKKGEAYLSLSTGDHLTKLRVIVVSPNIFGIIEEIQHQISGQDVNFEVVHETLYVSGKISQIEDYRHLQKQFAKYPFLDKSKLELSVPLRNQLISEIYYYFFNQNIDVINCTEKHLQFICHYALNETEVPNSLSTIIPLLQKKHDALFIKIPPPNINENFILKIKIIQIEKLNGEELDFGLDHFGGSFSDLFNIGVKGILQKHQFYFQQQNSDLSTLAEPEINIKLNKPATIEVGSEISFKEHLTNNSDAITTKWKFAGLKLKVKLIPKGENFEVEYQTSFSRTENASISTNQEKSAIQINLDNPIKLFEIGLRTTANQESSMPLLNQIPILKNIFTSKSKQDNFKKITGIIKLERGVVP